ncbi:MULTISPECIES: hypothetical protein [unclassified Pseudoalteromonas]|uniref:hypothetical protein n=1 Tax=unclassified Pseudoalteromonas TaxID=194690 RepID=UPI002097F7E0|nr:hypothetical protein [Pseudoalteromonas sp. XMcav2-N]MCO7188101.1 hypothetical protein [Pseudoalteromonas sp. XMcav2-N]
MNAHPGYCLLPALLCGCMTSPAHVNQPDTERYTESFIRTQVVMPSYQLIWRTCRNHVLTGDWPTMTGLADSSAFSELTTIRTTDREYQQSFQLSGVNTPIQFSLTRESPTSESYQVLIQARFDRGDYTHSANISCSYDGLTEEALTQLTHHTTSVFNLYQTAQSEYVFPSPKTQSVTDDMIRAAPCSLLRLTPDQCRV